MSIISENIDIISQGIQGFAQISQEDVSTAIAEISGIGGIGYVANSAKYLDLKNVNIMKNSVFQKDVSADSQTSFKKFIKYDIYEDYSTDLINCRTRNNYETIMPYVPTKIYFDIDIGNDKPPEYFTLEYANKVKDDIISQLLIELPGIDLNNDVMIMTAHKPGRKYSIHIVINKFYLDYRQFGYIYDLLKEKLDREYFVHKIIDCSLVRRKSNSLKQFRGLFNSKFGDKRDLVFEPEWSYKGQKISYNFKDLDPNLDLQSKLLEVYYDLMLDCSVIRSSKNLIECPIVVPEGWTISNIFSVQGLNRVTNPNISYEKYNITQSDMEYLMNLFEDRFSFEIQSSSENSLVLKRIRPSHCKICNKEHTSNGQYIVISNGNIYLRCFSADNNPGIITKSFKLGINKNMVANAPIEITVQNNYLTPDRNNVLVETPVQQNTLHLQVTPSQNNTVIEIPPPTISIQNGNIPISNPNIDVGDMTSAVGNSVNSSLSAEQNAPVLDEETIRANISRLRNSSRPSSNDRNRRTYIGGSSKYGDVMDLEYINPNLTGEEKHNITTAINTQVDKLNINDSYNVKEYTAGYKLYPKNDGETCGICCCMHTVNELVKVYYANYNGSVYQKCYKYGIIKKVEKIGTIGDVTDQLARERKLQLCNDIIKMRQLDLPANTVLEVYNEEYVRDLSPIHKIQGIKAGTGRGKTFAIIRLIKELRKQKADQDLPLPTILYITNRKSLGLNVVRTLNNIGVDIKSYDSISGKIFVSASVQVESLPRVTRFNYDLVVLDEITSLISQLNSGLHKNLQNTRDTLTDIMTASKQIVFMDADIDKRAFMLMDGIYGKEIPIHFSINRYVKEGRKHRCYDNAGNLFKSAINNLRKGKNVVFISNSENEARRFYEDVKKSNCVPLSEIRYYNGKDGIDMYKEEIADPNNYWTKFRCLIYTSTIGPGVDFNVEHFDYKYCFATSRSNCVREVFQMIGRVRTTTTEELHYNISDVRYNRPIRKDQIIAKYNAYMNSVNDISKDIISEMSNDMKSKSGSNLPKSSIIREPTYFESLDMETITLRLDECNLFNQLMVDTKQEENISKNHFSLMFENKLEQEKYTPLDVDDALSFDDDISLINDAEFKKINNDKLKQLYLQSVCTDDTIEAAKIKKIQGVATAADNMVIEKSIIFKCLEEEKRELFTADLYISIRKHFVACINLNKVKTLSIHQILAKDYLTENINPLFPKAYIYINLLHIIKHVFPDEGIPRHELTKLIPYLRGITCVPGCQNENIYWLTNKIYKDTSRNNISTASEVASFINRILKTFAHKIIGTKRLIMPVDGINKKVSICQVKHLSEDVELFVSLMKEVSDPYKHMDPDQVYEIETHSSNPEAANLQLLLDQRMSQQIVA